MNKCKETLRSSFRVHRDGAGFDRDGAGFEAPRDEGSTKETWLSEATDKVMNS